MMMSNIHEDDSTKNNNYIMGNSDNDVGYQSSNSNDEEDKLYHTYVHHQM